MGSKSFFKFKYIHNFLMFNPKRHGVFGQLDAWKMQSRASKLSTNSILYETWYLQLKFETLLRSLRSKFGPLEVVEVAKVQVRKKNVSHFLKSSIFEQKNVIYLKRKLRTIVIDIWNKIKFLQFWIPKNCDFLSVSAKFLENLSRQ